MRKQKVYLAGGMHSDWREKIRTLQNVEFIDPKEKEVKRSVCFAVTDVSFLNHLFHGKIVGNGSYMKRFASAVY